MRGVLFFFNDTATTEIYTLSLHDALPIWRRRHDSAHGARALVRRVHREDVVGRRDQELVFVCEEQGLDAVDRKSTRLNSSHSQISYAGFCLNKNCSRHFNWPLPSSYKPVA